MYSHSTNLCWQANYSASTGYGTWEQSTTGPLGVSCSSVTSATWYTTATSLSGGATSTTAGPISSGYIGITHMRHEATQNAVFGGEMDGRTLSTNLQAGKPVEGEIYIVSTTGSVETLLTTTEVDASQHLRSTSVVDAASVGGLTGDSASILQSDRDSFTNLWTHSSTVEDAESRGYVSQRCPSATTNAYMSIEHVDHIFSRKPSIA